ncbi:hypothetical protein NDU88_001113 [Pleurodeles waltl]|uniref:Uncharacterized protein n=1 Tax=Pleurodeles waltl TaxID=8319 RepID=A0AAV7P7T1_PLEWA|nr:hypothetical protein NDU88_001113 [Pleurodeles waltl]
MQGGPITEFLLAPPRGVVSLGPPQLFRVASCSPPLLWGRLQGPVPVGRKGGLAPPPPGLLQLLPLLLGPGVALSRLRSSRGGLTVPAPRTRIQSAGAALSARAGQAATPGFTRGLAQRGKEGRKPAPEPVGRSSVHARPGSRMVTGRHPGSVPSPAVAFSCCVARRRHAFLHEF